MPKLHSFPSNYQEFKMRLNQQTHHKLKIYAAINKKLLITCFDEAITQYLSVISFEELFQNRLQEIKDFPEISLSDRRLLYKIVIIAPLMPIETMAKLIFIADLKGKTISALMDEIVLNYLEK